ncbi:MAG: hypothetical protein GY796_11195 [Chloroflexi bacterium]|nr:hypothetical protein [Chloroflexota bacterium]
MSNFYNVANPGSALGEAIGSSMEKALQNLLIDVADEYGCHYLTSGVRKTKAGNRAKKLLLADNFGNEYDIDGVIADASMRPLILFESKYIRYKKHNRDKGSWVCTAHSAIRRRYHSIRSSVAILAGSWSKSFIAMMESHDVTIFLIPFDFICDQLEKVGVNFRWGEKEKEKAFVAWENYNQLTNEEQDQIGRAMIQVVGDKLLQRIESILDESVPREVEKVIIEIISNFGEVKIFEFDSVAEAIEFLEQENLESYFLTIDSVTLFEPPPTYENN